MNFDKFFALAKEAGITESQIQVSKSSELSVRLFRKEIDNYSVNDSQSIIACGIYKGRFGSARTEKLGKDTFDYLVKEIIRSASFVEAEGAKELFKGSEKYHKKNTYNKELPLIPVSEKIALLHKMEEKALAMDPRVYEVSECEYSETESESQFYNSHGLKLKQKNNYFVVVLGVGVKDGEGAKSGFQVKVDSDLKSFDADAFVKKAVDEAIAKIGGVQCASGVYPTVLHRDVFGSLLGFFLEAVSSDEVQRQSSFLIGQLGKKIASSKLTIEEKPLTKNVFFSYFDDEGVAAQNKYVVKNGVLQTYFYNLETARKEGRGSTGNGRWAGSKIGIGFSNVFVKPGKSTFGELIAPIKEGVYITDVAGLGTGINPRSGDFSCQAQGFMIRDGKLAEPLNLITLSGNLLKMLKDLKGFDNEAELKYTSLSCADAFIKGMSIGGK